MECTRLAPSPTGALHLGNARTFLVNWLHARQNGARVILRIEDLDGPRIKAGAGAAAIVDLQWLGLDWDEGPIYQSTRSEVYEAAVEALLRQGDAYPCICTRREVERAASAPHAEDGAAVYPGVCRGRFGTVAEARGASGREPAIRFRVPSAPDGVVAWEDGFCGRQQIDVPARLGDFVIAKSDGTPAYQLAVVADDAAMGVTDVIRGDDLIESTPRQILLFRALGWAAKIPRYWHLPLVVGAEGRRLAKRHGDTRLSRYRDLGVPAGRVLKLLARWCGIEDATPIAQASDLLPHFRIEHIPARRITFGTADDAWLLQNAGSAGGT